MFRYNKNNNEKGKHKLKSILLIMLSIIVFKFVSGILFMTFVYDEENEILLISYGLYSNIFVIAIVMAINCFYNKKALKNIGLGYRDWAGFLKGIRYLNLYIINK